MLADVSNWMTATHISRARFTCAPVGAINQLEFNYTLSAKLYWLVSPGMIKQTPPPRADNDNNNSDNFNVATKTIISGNCDKPAEIHLVILFLGHFLERIPFSPSHIPVECKGHSMFRQTQEWRVISMANDTPWVAQWKRGQQWWTLLFHTHTLN